MESFVIRRVQALALIVAWARGETVEMYKVTVGFVMHMESHDVSAARHRRSLVQSKSASHSDAAAWCREAEKKGGEEIKPQTNTGAHLV